jgi:hypothetical protein
MFGEVEYDPQRAYAAVPLEEQLEALSAAAAAGKIRSVGLSNETAWGLMECCKLGVCMRETKQAPCICMFYSHAMVISLRHGFAACCTTHGTPIPEMAMIKSSRNLKTSAKSLSAGVAADSPGCEAAILPDMSVRAAQERQDLIKLVALQNAYR